MHEFGLAQGVLDAVLRRAAGRPVRRVRLRAGVRHGLDQASLAQAFGLLAEGTEAEGAALDLVAVPLRLTCLGCGWSAWTADPLAGCAGCAGGEVATAGGDELVLESLTYATGAMEEPCAWASPPK
jgi:hydrogenase nickel incorporation protein HypA/HybF